MTRDLSVARRVARRLQSGQVQINPYSVGRIGTPFGGYKHRGMGREKGARRSRTTPSSRQ
jgi:acyl-CoA reductase-like NAD-dependent aldehyde dehydrogenase